MLPQSPTSLLRDRAPETREQPTPPCHEQLSYREAHLLPVLSHALSRPRAAVRQFFQRRFRRRRRPPPDALVTSQILETSSWSSAPRPPEFCQQVHRVLPRQTILQPESYGFVYCCCARETCADPHSHYDFLGNLGSAAQLHRAHLWRRSDIRLDAQSKQSVRRCRRRKSNTR